MIRAGFRFFVLFLFWLLSPPVYAKEIRLDKGVFDNGTLEFKSHKGEGEFDSYLAMDVRFKPVEKVYKALKRKLRLKLVSRGEAHITVITPVEFRPHLETKISIDEIDAIARRMDLQKSKFQVVGIGSGTAVLENKKEQTFFLVLKSEDLLKIRQEVHRLFVAKGGDPKLFDPKKFYPHITLGFTKQDLHESDGVIKDERSLGSRVELQVEPL